MIDSESLDEKRIPRKQWMNALVLDLTKTTPLIAINSNTLVDLSKIIGLSISANTSSDHSDGAFNLQLHLDGGGVIDTKGLSREQIEIFKEYYIKYNEVAQVQSKIFRR